MNITLAIKIKLRNLTQHQSHQLKQVLIQNTKARNYDSAIYFNHYQNLKARDFHKLTYHPAIKKFHLKSLMAESDRRAVKANYTTLNTQRKKTTYKFPDINNYKIVISKKTHKHTKKYKYYHCKEDGKWIWHRIHYNRPYADLQYKYDWKFLTIKHKLSINTLSHKHGHTRMKCDYFIPKYFFKYFKMPHKWGASKLLMSGHNFWLHAGLTVHVKSIKDLAHAHNISGSDRGDRFVGFYKDDKNNVIGLRGLPIRRKRKHFLKMRRTLQEAHARHHNYSALKKLSENREQENNYVACVNHKCSKILASNLGQGGVLGLEELSGVRSQLQSVAKKHRYTQVSWAFGEFGSEAAYKVQLKGGRMTHIPAQYTSQRDPITGKVGRNHRHHSNHTYYSFKKHYSKKLHKIIPYQFNDDYVGGYNIHFLTVLACLNYHKPTIQPNGSIKYYIIYKRHGKKHVRTLYLGRLQAIKIYMERKTAQSL